MIADMTPDNVVDMINANRIGANRFGIAAEDGKGAEWRMMASVNCGWPRCDPCSHDLE
jgi:hypothetical protein